MKLLHALTFIFAAGYLLTLHACENKKQLSERFLPEKNKDSVTFVSGYSEVNGLKMYYEIYGDGEPLVLVHGGGSTIHTSFGRIIPAFVAFGKVIAVELQAHGHTSDRGLPSSFEQDADDVAALLKNLGIAKADFFGFSNGGNTVMRIAMRHPGIVRKLIIGSAFYKREGMIPGFWDGMTKAGFAELPQPYKDEFLKIRNDTAALYTMFQRDLIRMQTFRDWTDDDLKSIKSPSLIIVGDNDIMTPEHAVKMSRLIPNAELAIIPGGHGTYMGELTTLSGGDWRQPFVTDLILQFLKKDFKLPLF